MHLGSLKAIFVEVSQFYQISLKILPNLTDFSSQLMACMSTPEKNGNSQPLFKCLHTGLHQHSTLCQSLWIKFVCDSKALPVGSLGENTPLN